VEGALKEHNEAIRVKHRINRRRKHRKRRKRRPTPATM
jgi:hypothetical protein